MTFAPSKVEKTGIGAMLLLSLFFCFFVWQQADALIVSPARLEIEGDSGEKVSSTLDLVNNQDETKTFFSSAENFEAQGETGIPHFVESDEELAAWINVKSQIILEPGERKEIPFTVSIPTDAGVGGHFAAIFWSTKPPDVGKGQIAVGAKVGILVFLKVRGDIVEQGEIIEISSLAEKTVFDSLPIDLMYRFENSGNDRTKPIGELVIKNTFGKEVEKIPANKKQGSVLPESVRKFFISWGRDEAEDVEKKFKEGTLYPPESFFAKAKSQLSPFAIGKYSANLSLNYGLQDNKANAQFAFWVIPWQLITIILSILLVVLFGGRLTLRRYNKLIIARAQKAQK
ncbi:MAG: hypothetical protein U9M90_00655 [Patescibacteria group bacterium]|nr:hypothetical protein [Patescibacteria group bacterium]